MADGNGNGNGTAPAPRLRAFYHDKVKSKLMQEFGFANLHQVPRLEKIVLNVGMGDAQKNPKVLDSVIEELGAITGQKAVITRAKKAISNFSLRQGVPVGARVTLRSTHMWEFLDRFISVSVPRIRDFRGFPRGLIRRPRQLFVRDPGANGVSRDRLRQSRPDSRHGHHVRDDSYT